MDITSVTSSSSLTTKPLRTLAAAATLAIAGLVVTGCSSNDPQPSDTATGSVGVGLEELTDDTARPDQSAAVAGAARADSFGFDLQTAATPEEIATSREMSQEQELTTDPASCAPALTGIDWSPIMIDTEEQTRIDFGSPNFEGTGTIEVAALDDPAELETYLDNVDTLKSECQDMTVRTPNPVEEDTVLTYSFTVEDVDGGLRWDRAPQDSVGQALTALVLTTQHATDSGDYAVMVSFAGLSEVHDDEFEEMARAILDTTLEGLDDATA